jgi:hypothetical protein
MTSEPELFETLNGRLGPLGHLSTVTIPKVAGENQNEVHEPPNPQPAEGQQLENPGTDLPGIEAMRTEDPKKEAQQECGKNLLLRCADSTERTRRRLWSPASWTYERSRLDDVAAVRANLCFVSDRSCHRECSGVMDLGINFPILTVSVATTSRKG